MSFTPPPPPPPMPPGPPAAPGGSPRPGRGARAGAIVAGVVVLATGVGTALYLLPGRGGAPQAAPSRTAPPPPTATSASPTPSDTPDLPYVVLKPGTCFDHPNLTKGLRKVTVRPCTGPHDGEAVANVTVRGDFSKDSEIASAVYRQCTDAAKAKADRQPEGSRFYSFVLTPSAELYKRGYREATCTLTAAYTVGGKKLTGSLR